jgi:hypothetical protein
MKTSTILVIVAAIAVAGVAAYGVYTYKRRAGGAPNPLSGTIRGTVNPPVGLNSAVAGTPTGDAALPGAVGTQLQNIQTGVSGVIKTIGDVAQLSKDAQSAWGGLKKTWS